MPFEPRPSPEPDGLRAAGPRRAVAAALLLATLATAGHAAVLPVVFPEKQLVIQTDEFVQTRTKRPGDGQRHRMGGRFGPRWVALSQTRETRPDDERPAVWRMRELDYLYWPAKNGRILRMNNAYEFCAWAKDHWIDDVEFLDLGFRAGKEDCPRDLEFYVRNQHPANDEWAYQERGAFGVPGEAPYDPFAGRPPDAMYGDVFTMELSMRAQVGQDDGSVRWEPLPSGGDLDFGARVEFEVRVASEDVLPLRILRVFMIANHHSRASREDEERLSIVMDQDPTAFPTQLPPGETYTTTFGVTRAMMNVYDRVVRVHVFVDFEDPEGERRRRRVSAYYWKGAF